VYELFEWDCCGHNVETSVELAELLGRRINETGVFCCPLVDGECFCGVEGKAVGNKNVYRSIQMR